MKNKADSKHRTTKLQRNLNTNAPLAGWNYESTPADVLDYLMEQPLADEQK